MPFTLCSGNSAMRAQSQEGDGAHGEDDRQELEQGHIAGRASRQKRPGRPHSGMAVAPTSVQTTLGPGEKHRTLSADADINTMAATTNRSENS